MSTIRLGRAINFVALILISSSAWGGELDRRILEDPVFGMRYETAKVKFETLPSAVLSHCLTLVDNGNAPRIWHLYGKAHDAVGHSYYLVDEVFGAGSVFEIDGDNCAPRGSVDEMFGSDLPILPQLAADIASRFNRAFGTDRLAVELHNQRIEPERLPLEVRQAFSPYLGAPAPVFTEQAPPRVLRDPVLGLRHDASANFGSLPNHALNICGDWIGHDQFSIGHFRVYAQARDARGNTYFITAGYVEMRVHSPTIDRYPLALYGDAFQVKGAECVMYSASPIREVFRDAAIPQPILRKLANDLVARLITVFGHEGLRVELRNQHVDWDSLPPFLQAVLKPYRTK